jgi:Helix-turn-helix domain
MASTGANTTSGGSRRWWCSTRARYPAYHSTSHRADEPDRQREPARRVDLQEMEKVLARQEMPVDPAAGPLQQFAHDLRQVRQQAGNPTYQALAREVGYSASTLSEAASGRRLPSLEVTLAYVGGCRGDVNAWRVRWMAVREQVDAGRLTPPEPVPAATEPAANAGASTPWPAIRVPEVHSARPERRRTDPAPPGVVQQPAPQSNPLIERTATWLAVLGTVISLVFGVTQQRPASTVALAIGLLIVLTGTVIFVTIATTKDGLRRFPVKVRRATLIAWTLLGLATTTAFAVPTSREAMVHDVLGFPSVSQQVRVVDVNVALNDNSYRVEIIVLNKLRTEELVHDVQMDVDPDGCLAAPHANYKIDAAFRLVVTGENGATLTGNAIRPDDDGLFYSPVAGTMRNCDGTSTANSLSLTLGVGTPLPPGQHTTISLEVPRTIEVEVPDPQPSAPHSSPAPRPTTPPTPQKINVAVHIPVGPATDPSAVLTVTLLVGDSREKISHTSR